MRSQGSRAPGQQGMGPEGEWQSRAESKRGAGGPAAAAARAQAAVVSAPCLVLLVKETQSMNTAPQRATSTMVRSAA